ncbi:MAG: flagellar basal-body MS-ring/collar protein FliF, partial [Firmicutes bacterium]|nr:flagellar basal-body MS-ring/collar protein FliF [Bacillota bacterium]
MDQFKHYLDKVKTWWQSLSATQKWRYGGLSGLALATVIAGSDWLTNPDYTPLYTNLTAKTAGQITGQLTQLKMPYQLADQGQTVLVPKKDVDQARIDLADANITVSGTLGLPQPMTFSLGETSQELQLDQLNNTESTLDQTIESIQGVHAARVLINQPPPTLFGEAPDQPTASVFVMLNAGDKLSAGQVHGIMNLVAHSVSGMHPNEVTVVNQYGQLLSSEAAESGAAQQVSSLSQAELADEAGVEDHIKNNIETMLDQMLGPGAAVVRVHAALNFNHGNVTNTTYGHGQLSSQQTSSSSSTSQG